MCRGRGPESKLAEAVPFLCLVGEICGSPIRSNWRRKLGSRSQRTRYGIARLRLFPVRSQLRLELSLPSPVNAMPLIVSLGGSPGNAAGAQPPIACRHPCGILNRMVQYSQTHFDASFGALSDATRRGVLEQLGRADVSITALAERFHMTLTGIKKHVGVLEQAGLVSTEKVGRVRTCKLGLRGLEEEAAWIERYRQLWAARFDELDIVVEELKRKEKVTGRKKRK